MRAQRAMVTSDTMYFTRYGFESSTSYLNAFRDGSLYHRAYTSTSGRMSGSSSRRNGRRQSCLLPRSIDFILVTRPYHATCFLVCGSSNAIAKSWPMPSMSLSSPLPSASPVIMTCSML